MYDESFSFAGIDMREKFGLFCESVQDNLVPALRPRKTVIPNRNGEYDHGALAYDSRTVTVYCGTVRPISEATRREIAHALSRKGTLRFHFEPERYYVGRLYDATPIERIGTDMIRLQLDFICEPFAYGDPIEIPVKTGENVISYPGTAPAGFQLVLKNTGNSAITRIQVKVVGKG